MRLKGLDLAKAKQALKGLELLSEIDQDSRPVSERVSGGTRIHG